MYARNATPRAAFFIGLQSSPRPQIRNSVNKRKSPGSSGQTLLVGTTLTGIGGYSIAQIAALAQSFKLKTHAHAPLSVTFVIGGSWGSPSVPNSIGGDVAFSATLTTAPNLSATPIAQQWFTFISQPTLYSTTFSLPVSVDLAPGTYYLILTTSSPWDAGSLAWPPNAPIKTNFGSMGQLYA